MKYVFNTWLLANVIHPIALMVLIRNSFPSVSEGIGFGIQWFFYSLVFTLPSLVMAIVLNRLLQRTGLAKWRKFMLLLLASPIIVVMNILTVSAILQVDIILFFGFLYMIPSMTSGFLAVLFRWKQFMVDEKRNSGAVITINAADTAS